MKMKTRSIGLKIGLLKKYNHSRIFSQRLKRLTFKIEIFSWLLPDYETKNGKMLKTDFNVIV